MRGLSMGRASRSVTGPGHPMEVYIALLRGVNVGGRNKLPMKRLAAIVEDVVGGSATTFIQSGNVVFEAARDRREELPDAIQRAILEEESIATPVVLRTLDELRSVVTGNPYIEAGCDLKQLHVAFLAEEPAAARVATLDPQRSPPDEFTVRGREIYLRCPDGLARTKLTNAYFDSRLETTSTVRNWRTTVELVALAERRASIRSPSR
jgi:uncharacterized protein (DUF1697 family)